MALWPVPKRLEDEFARFAQFRSSEFCRFRTGGQVVSSTVESDRANALRWLGFVCPTYEQGATLRLFACARVGEWTQAWLERLRGLGLKASCTPRARTRLLPPPPRAHDRACPPPLCIPLLEQRWRCTQTACSRCATTRSASRAPTPTSARWRSSSCVRQALRSAAPVLHSNSPLTRSAFDAIRP